MIPRDDFDDDDADVPADVRRLLAEDSPKRRGYVVAGVIGCIVGQVLLLGFLIASRHSIVSRVADIVVPSQAVTTATVTPPAATQEPAPASSSTSEATTAAPTRAEAPTTAAPTPAEARAPAASDTAAVSETTTPVTTTPVTPADSPATATDSTPASPTPAPAAVELPQRTTTPSARSSEVPRREASTPPPSIAEVPRRVVPPPSSIASPAAPPRPRVTRFNNWAESQAQVRAALREWLVSSGLGGESLASDAVVILDPDGRTARTHVPIRWGGVMMVREQRWERRAGRWTLVAERNIGDQR